MTNTKKTVKKASATANDKAEAMGLPPKAKNENADAQEDTGSEDKKTITKAALIAALGFPAFHMMSSVLGSSTTVLAEKVLLAMQRHPVQGNKSPEDMAARAHQIAAAFANYKPEEEAPQEDQPAPEGE